MLFWHIGGAVFLFRWVFKDPLVDLRFLAAGALLPNVVDMAASIAVEAGWQGIGRGAGHTLLLSAVVMVLAMSVTRPRTRGRRRAVAVAVGVMFHLLLDGMWTAPELLLWPLAGWDLPSGFEAEWAGLPDSFLESPLRPVQELAGLGYLVWLGRRARLRDPALRSRLLRAGTIEV